MGRWRPPDLAARPREAFHAEVSRVAGALDASTRSLRVELDVPNPDGRLLPGMYAEASWPVQVGEDALFVPSTAVVRSTERVYVLAVRDGRVARVDVQPGLADGTDIAVSGELRAGDAVAVRGSEDLVPEMAVNAAPEKESQDSLGGAK